MDDISTLQREYETARAEQAGLRDALERAKARLRVAQNRSMDLSILDVDALADGAFDVDPDQAVRAVRELERRLRESQEKVNGSRQHIYLASTAAVIEEYLTAVDSIVAAAAVLLEHIEEAQGILAAGGVRQLDSRVFSVNHTRHELEHLTETYAKWCKGPQRWESYRRWVNKDGTAEDIPQAEFDRREAERLAQRVDRRPWPYGTLQFFEPTVNRPR